MHNHQEIKEKQRILPIEYHYVSDESFLRNFKKISPTLFENHLKKLIVNRQALSVDELLVCAEKNKSYPQHCFIPTFDDSLRPTMKAVLPILQRNKVQAIFFINTAPLINQSLNLIEKQRILQYVGSDYATFFREFCQTALEMFPHLPQNKFADTEKNREFAKQNYHPEFTFYSPLERYYRLLRDDYLKMEEHKAIIDEMFDNNFDEYEWINMINLRENDLLKIREEGHIIAGHSHTHPFNMKKLNHHLQEAEIKQNLKEIEKILNEPISIYAHPSNSFDETTINVLKQYGIKCAFKADYTFKSMNDYYRVPRIDAGLLYRFLEEENNENTDFNLKPSKT